MIIYNYLGVNILSCGKIDKKVLWKEFVNKWLIKYIVKINFLIPKIS